MDSVSSRAPASGVEAVGLSRAFGPHRALDRVDLAAPPGRVSALVGPPSCGKTTLLRVAAGLLAPDAGTVRVAAVDVGAEPRAARRRLGWMAEGVGTWDDVRVDDALSALAAAHRLPRAARHVGEVRERVGLSASARQRVGDLSLLERRRLGLAQALLHDPPVLLLDAPLGGLDPGDRSALAVDLRRLAGDGRTALLSARTPAEVEGVADLLFTMATGRVVSARDTAPAPERRWRVLVRAGDHLRAVLGAHGVPCADAPVGAGHPAVDVVVPAGPKGDDEAAALLALLVREGVEVLAFGPTDPEPR